MEDEPLFGCTIYLYNKVEAFYYLRKITLEKHFGTKLLHVDLIDQLDMQKTAKIEIS